jgi:hypothetical protein
MFGQKEQVPAYLAQQQRKRKRVGGEDDERGWIGRKRQWGWDGRLSLSCPRQVYISVMRVKTLEQGRAEKKKIP